MSIITVIIPIYNAEKYLLRTMQCLQKQTFSDFEVLLMDDGSKDGSANILKEISKDDSRFRYIYQENQGVSAARNHGVELSKGKYITFLDADDVIPQNYLEKLINPMRDHSCQMSVCDVAVITDGKETKRFRCECESLTQLQALNLLLSREEINSGPYAKMFCREILDGIFFPPLKAYEDILFVISAVSKCEKIGVTTDTEYQYIQNEGSAMSTFLKVPPMDVVTATKQIVSFIKERKDLSDQCLYVTLSHLMQYVQPLMGHDSENARDFVRASKRIYKQNLTRIWRCSAFPWKEKITYTLFAFGWH